MKFLLMNVHSVLILLYVWYYRDRFRTATNVWGDSIGAKVVEKLSKDDLAKFDHDADYVDEHNLGL